MLVHFKDEGNDLNVAKRQIYANACKYPRLLKTSATLIELTDITQKLSVFKISKTFWHVF